MVHVQSWMWVLLHTSDNPRQGCTAVVHQLLRGCLRKGMAGSTVRSPFSQSPSLARSEAAELKGHMHRRSKERESKSYSSSGFTRKSGTEGNCAPFPPAPSVPMNSCFRFTFLPLIHACNSFQRDLSRETALPALYHTFDPSASFVWVHMVHAAFCQQWENCLLFDFSRMPGKGSSLPGLYAMDGKRVTRFRALEYEWRKNRSARKREKRIFIHTLTPASNSTSLLS